jgi:hypothetical protein
LLEETNYSARTRQEVEGLEDEAEAWDPQQGLTGSTVFVTVRNVRDGNQPGRMDAAQAEIGALLRQEAEEGEFRRGQGERALGMSGM